jgi:monothiol glutaredoxin
MALSDTMRKQIQELVEREPVLLFMKGTRTAPACGFSAQVVQILDALAPRYATVDVLTDPAMRDGIKEFSEWPTIPQLYVAGKFVGGCDIVRELSASGELETLLGGGDTTEPAVPRITVSAAAAAAFQGAVPEGDAIHFQIGPGFQYDLYVGPREPGDIEVQAGSISVLIDRATARRADGVHIDYIGGEGGGFKIENPQEPPRVRQITAPELSEMLGRGEVDLFDVRPEAERARASIGAARPLDQSGEQHLLALPRDRAVAFHCHHGIRSQAAAEQALSKGFSRVYNLRGGIDAWSAAVDPSVPRY